MKPETIAPTSVNATTAPGFHLSPTLDWQSELVRRRGRVTIVPIPTQVARREALPVDQRNDESGSVASAPVDWSCVEQRLREVYPHPVGGASLAELISEGRGDR